MTLNTKIHHRHEKAPSLDPTLAYLTD